MYNRRVLEVLTVSAGLCFLVVKTWSLSSKSFAIKQFPGVTAVDLVLTLLVESMFSLRDVKLYRPGDAGLWCCLILPAILRITSPFDWELFHFLAPCTLIVYLMRVEVAMATWSSVAGLGVYTMAQWMILMTGYSAGYTGILLGYSIVYCGLLWYVPRWYPRSFTFGEVAMVTQLLTYFLYTSLGYLLFYKVASEIKPLDKLTGIAYIGVLMVIGLISKVAKSAYPVSGVIVSISAVGGAFCIPAALHLVRWKELLTVMSRLFWSRTSMLLLLWWMTCLLISILLVVRYGSRLCLPYNDGNGQEERSGSLYDVPNATTLDGGDLQNYYESRRAKDHLETKFKIQKTAKSCSFKTCTNQEEKIRQDKSSDHTAGSQRDVCAGCQVSSQRVPASVRKYFHVAMLLVYVPGLLYRPDLLYLASVAAAGALIIIEAVRVSAVPVLSGTLDLHLRVFLDHQDQGDLIVTPVYLLLGCSLPLWLEHRNTGHSRISLYAGLISIGVGDSLASLVGRKYGRHKWPDSQKSIEGTLAAVIGQTLTVILLSFCGVPDSGLSMSLVLVMCLSACLEAFSTQIDNLVVPMFTYMLLAATSLQP